MSTKNLTEKELMQHAVGRRGFLNFVGKMKSQLCFAACLFVIVAMAMGCGDDFEPTNNSTTNNSTTNNSTTNNSTSNNSTSNNSATNNSQVLTWDEGMDNFLKARCSRCHTWVLNYEQTTTDLVSLREKVEERHGNLTAADRDIILLWIDAGAPRE